mgnify:CR=1 FL=1
MAATVLATAALYFVGEGDWIGHLTGVLMNVGRSPHRRDHLLGAGEEVGHAHRGISEGFVSQGLDLLAEQAPERVRGLVAVAPNVAPLAPLVDPVPGVAGRVPQLRSERQHAALRGA